MKTNTEHIFSKIWHISKVCGSVFRWREFKLQWLTETESCNIPYGTRGATFPYNSNGSIPTEPTHSRQRENNVHFFFFYVKSKKEIRHFATTMWSLSDENQSVIWSLTKLVTRHQQWSLHRLQISSCSMLLVRRIVCVLLIPDLYLDKEYIFWIKENIIIWQNLQLNLTDPVKQIYIIFANVLLRKLSFWTKMTFFFFFFK